jgi:hypothetical protein
VNIQIHCHGQVLGQSGRPEHCHTDEVEDVEGISDEWYDVPPCYATLRR